MSAPEDVSWSSAVASYRSMFRNWEKRASVRVKPQRRLADEDDSETYFPPELVPVANHHIVAGKGPEAVRETLIARLYQYLDFTTVLEATAVIPVTTDISLGRTGIDLPGEMRRDAFKISTDEAWHAQFSDDLMHQLVDRTGVPIRLPGRPLFTDRLAALYDRICPSLHGALPLAFATVSETLISEILSDLPRDTRLPRAVRETVADHAEDEGRHHAYFRQVLPIFWHTLDGPGKRELGRFLPDLIRIFLEPDHRRISTALFGIGLTDDEVVQVLAETHSADIVTRDLAVAARATIRYLRESGVLDAPVVLDAFLASGLITE